MSLVYPFLGVLLLVIVVVDLLWTTLWVEGGAGPLTSRLMAGSWRILRKIGSQNSLLLSLSGPIVFVTGLSVWIMLLWSGWILIFATTESVLIDTLSRGPITWSDRIYFTGYTIFTLGTGDFVPQGSIWQIVTILATASGLLFITLAITYSLSVLDAVTQKRAFASEVSGLGMNAEEVLQTSWSGEQFYRLELPLNTITSQLDTLTVNHKAYPILHYFYSRRSEEAAVHSIAVLDEALTLFLFGVREEHRPDDLLINSARSSVQNYLRTLHSAFITPANDSPPLPALGAVREIGIPTVSDEEFAASIENLDERRRTLLGLVEADARQWPARKPGE